MRPRRNIFRVIVGSLLIYLFSYIGISLGGHYEPAAYGVMQGPDEIYLVIPKPVLGYDWNPFWWSRFDPPAKEALAPKFVYYFYLPLIFLDQKVWHTNKTVEQLKSEEYSVKHFFDYKKKAYRDIKP